MKRLYTIGFTKKKLEEFVSLLEGHKIKKVVDIRLRNDSQLAGFAKGDDLKFLLEKFLGMKYTYQPSLAPTKEMLKKYRSDKNWDDYVVSFNKLMQEREMHIILKKIISDSDGVCLLCSEDIPKQCHRRLLAEYYKEFDNSVNIMHLTKRDLKNRQLCE